MNLCQPIKKLRIQRDCERLQSRVASLRKKVKHETPLIIALTERLTMWIDKNLECLLTVPLFTRFSLFFCLWRLPNIYGVLSTSLSCMNTFWRTRYRSMIENFTGRRFSAVCFIVCFYLSVSFFPQTFVNNIFVSRSYFGSRYHRNENWPKKIKKSRNGKLQTVFVSQPPFHS